VLVVAIGVLATACAAGSSAGGSRPSPENRSAPAGGDPSAALRANAVRPDPRAVDLRPLRWSRIEASSDGRTLTVHFTVSGPPCQVLGRVSVEQTPAAVTVTLLAGRLPGARCTGPQPPLAAPSTTTIRLAAPLAARPVHDGAR
jgi:hypothetical protein